MSQIRYVVSRDSVTFRVDGVATVISKTHANYDNILATLASGDIEAVRPLLVDTRQYIANTIGNGSLISYRNGKLYFGDEVLHNAIANRIVSLIRDGYDVAPLTNFLSNLMKNPSYRAVTELYGFLEKCKLPFTPDGHFIAYKVIRADWKDKHTGTMDNSIGAVVKMRRNEVDENKDQTCSAGLHFCSRDYIKEFISKDAGDRLVAVKVNPRDVVSIPTDYNDTKGRACEYTILRELRDGANLPVNHAGFNLLVDDEPVTAGPDGTRTQSRVGAVVWTDADIAKAKRLLAEPDASLTAVAKETGMSRRQVARIRDGEVGASITA